MTQDEFIKHACEQVLRFSRVEHWGDLSEEIKVQLGFNMGAMALGLNLSKEEGYSAFSSAQKGETSMLMFREHLERVVREHGVPIDSEKVERPF